MLAAVSDSLKIYDFNAPELTLVSNRGGFPGRLNSVAWNHTNQVVATGGQGKVIHLVQASNCQLLSEVPFAGAQERAILHSDTHIQSDITSLSFSNSSRYLASSSSDTIHIWDLKRRNLRANKQVGRSALSSVLFVQDGGKIVCGNADGQIYMWDFDGESVVSEFAAVESKLDSVTTMAMSQGLQMKLASGHMDGSTSIWDLGTASHLRKQSVHTGQLTDLSFSPKNSRLLATAGLDGRINLVDTASKSSADPSASVNVGERLTCISFSPDGIHSAVGTETGHIFMFDWRNLRSPVSVSDAYTPAPVKALSFQAAVKVAPATPVKKVPTTQEVPSMASIESNISDVTENSTVVKGSLSNFVKSAAFVADKNEVRVTDPNSLTPKATRIVSTDLDSHSARASPLPPPPSAREPLIPSVKFSITEQSISADPERAPNEPLTLGTLQSTLNNFRYDIHKEFQVIIKEQIRLFGIAKDDNAELVRELSAQLGELLKANKELREENERLRHIY